MKKQVLLLCENYLPLCPNTVVIAKTNMNNEPIQLFTKEQVERLVSIAFNEGKAAGDGEMRYLSLKELIDTTKPAITLPTEEDVKKSHNPPNQHHIIVMLEDARIDGQIQLLNKIKEQIGKEKA